MNINTLFHPVKMPRNSGAL